MCCIAEQQTYKLNFPRSEFVDSIRFTKVPYSEKVIESFLRQNFRKVAIQIFVIAINFCCIIFINIIISFCYYY